MVFKNSSFLHLTGVNTKLKAKEFYKHAKTKNGLKVQEFFFDKNHPYDLAEKKTELILLCGAYKDKHGKLIDNCLVPYSFRIEDISSDKFGEFTEQSSDILMPVANSSSATAIFLRAFFSGMKFFIFIPNFIPNML